MRRGTLRTPAWTLAAFGLAAAGFLVAACGSSDDPNSINGPGGPNDPNNPNNQQPTEKTPEEQIKQILDQRKTDYGEALRTASLKLRDRLPSMEEIKQIEGASDKKAVYEKLVDDMLASPEFSRAMVKFWKDTMRVGFQGTRPDAQNPPQPLPQNVDKDAAPVFAAQLIVEGKSFMDLFTAKGGTCPKFDATAGTFAAGDCDAPTPAQGNGIGAAATTPTVGILTDPGLMQQYYANLAFRRVRFFQETFVCNKFPSETQAGVPMGNGTYTGTMDFNSITGKQNKPDARVDFQDTKAVICANCHINLNKTAPLFMNFDANGAYRSSPAVRIPIPNEPLVNRLDYLPEAQSLQWRKDKPLTDMASLGGALAADPDVARCAVNRIWNYAMSRGDIVADQASVPNAVTDPYVQTFTSGGFKLKETIRAVFKSEDFTKF
jgi:hypothetical protein